MSKLKENDIIIGKDNNIYQVRKNKGCYGCCIQDMKLGKLKYAPCEKVLEIIFENYNKEDCIELIGPNAKSQLSFKIIRDGI